jgi:uncharacterized membrane protein YqjE
MVHSGKPDGIDGQQSLGDLVAQAAKDISSLVRYEISLAKSEMRMDLRRIGTAALIGVVALFGLCLIVVLLCFAYAYGLMAVGVWPWLAFIYVAVTCLVFIILGGLVAYLIVRRVTGMKMTRQTVMDDLSMLRRSEPSPNGSGPTATNPQVGAGTTAGIPPARP